MDKNKKLEKLTLRELMDYEQAISLIIRNYDNKIRMYDNTIEQSSYANSELSKIMKYGVARDNILSRIEEKIKEIM